MMTLLLFLATLCSIGLTLPLLIGLKFQIKNPNCEEEIKDVKMNILTIKILSSIITILVIICLILSSI